jgi:ankyrin repeat protein
LFVHLSLPVADTGRRRKGRTVPALPERPSQEHLRKQAKRLARERGVKLSEAQGALANDYGFRSWSALTKHVANHRGDDDKPWTGLFAAVRVGDANAVRRLLGKGVNPRLGDGRETALHAAARGNSVAVVEALIEGGALGWSRDRNGESPLDVARKNRGAAREAIVALLDRERIDDPSFRSAVEAIHAGDLARLIALIDAEPCLLRDRLVQQDAYRRAARNDYFGDPKLLWFVANNPALMQDMPRNIAEIAHAMIVRGVDQSDLDYTLGLVASSAAAREQGHQESLMRVLLAGGALPDRDVILVAAAHGELAPLRVLIDLGFPMTASIAATLGDDAALASVIAHASAAEIQDAFSMAVVNGRLEAARMTLAAGADVGAYMAVHEHGTALHSATVIDDAPMIEMLLAHGARADVRDKLWDSTPLEWAIHEGKERARAALEAASARGAREFD